MGCSSDSEGRPDSELGNLVISPVSIVHKVDLDKASRDADALLDAVLLPHPWISDHLGAHVMRGSSSVQVLEGNTLIEELDDTLLLEFDSKGHYRATLDNSKEYGRHALFDGKDLFLRPRFGLYHQRAPQTDTEADEIRTDTAAGAGDYLDLLAGGLEAVDKGSGTFHGRAVRTIGLQLAPSPRKRKEEVLAQRLWRNSIVVKTLSGKIALDIESGAPLSIELDGSIAFTRDGRNLEMHMQAERSIDDIGHSRTIKAPPADEVMRIGARRRALDERDTLLKNIAPPARNSPTPAEAPGDGA